MWRCHWREKNTFLPFLQFNVGFTDKDKRLLSFDTSKFHTINDSKFDIYFNNKGTYIPRKVDGIVQLEKDPEIFSMILQYVNDDF